MLAYVYNTYVIIAITLMIVGPMQKPAMETKVRLVKIENNSFSGIHVKLTLPQTPPDANGCPVFQKIPLLYTLKQESLHLNTT